MRKSLDRFLNSLVIFPTLPLITACSFVDTLPTEQERRERVNRFIAKEGYVIHQRYETDSSADSWRCGKQDVDIAMLAPKSSGSFPVIFYLPGLGEGANGGKIWREYWAEAGYAVLSLQSAEISNAFVELRPPANGPDTSTQNSLYDLPDGTFRAGKKGRAKRAKENDVRFLGRRYFAPKNLRKRSDILLCVWEKFKQQVEAKSPLYAKADLSRLIIAGYDIGAQTAAAASGENFGIEDRRSPDFNPLATIIFSPAVDLALGHLTTRYQRIGAPFLAITGGKDSDPYAIASPPVRKAFWQYAPPGGKYLLTLDNASHRFLSGGSFSARPERGEAVERTGRKAEKNRPNKNDELPDGGHSGRIKNGTFLDKRPEKPFADEDFAIILSISTAFLDAVGKSDQIAKVWLDELSSTWLKPRAKLDIK